MEKTGHPKHLRHLRKKVTKEGKNASPHLRRGLKNFIIDIDGVICEDIPNEEPKRMVTACQIPGAKEQVNEWHKLGHIITFFTARTLEHKKITQDWLKKHGFKYHNIIFCKPRGGNYHYIDDKHVKATVFKGDFNKFAAKKKI
jgi:ribonucleotide monophosphatase NagD (HAD superfamily)